MTKELANFLRLAVEHCSGDGVDVREDYSGRGMYGQSTFGIVVDSVPELMLNVIQYLKEEMEQRGTSQTAINFADTEIPDVSSMGKLRIDSMGRQTILY